MMSTPKDTPTAAPTLIPSLESEDALFAELEGEAAIEVRVLEEGWVDVEEVSVDDSEGVDGLAVTVSVHVCIPPFAVTVMTLGELTLAALVELLNPPSITITHFRVVFRVDPTVVNGFKSPGRLIVPVPVVQLQLGLSPQQYVFGSSHRVIGMPLSLLPEAIVRHLYSNFPTYLAGHPLTRSKAEIWALASRSPRLISAGSASKVGIIRIATWALGRRKSTDAIW